MKIILNKKSNTGKPLIWEGSVKGNVITVIHGQVGGKLQTKSTMIMDGKNIGKSNETTPAQQALIELESTARSKMEKDYVVVNGYVFTTLNQKQIKVQNKEIPAPMLAFPIDKQLKKVEGRYVQYQAKLDGFRAVYSVDEEKFYSRSRKELIGCPEIITQLIKLKKSLIGIDFLDGELYSPTLTFESIASVVSPKKTLAPIEERSKVQYHIFDYVNEEETFKERNERLLKLKIAITDLKLDKLKLVSTASITVETLDKTLKPIVEQYINNGFEGIMIRIPESKYECKRSYGIFKYKLFEDCEAICITIKPETNRPDILGSISFRLPNGKEFDARPAMTEEERDLIFKNQKKYIGKTGVIKYQNLSEYGIPRFPVFTGKWREKWDMDKI